jgi:hypothetical protein
VGIVQVLEELLKCEVEPERSEMLVVLVLDLKEQPTHPNTQATLSKA